MFMTDQDASFSGSIPANYDAWLGPMFFEPYAEDLARRCRRLHAAATLEIAAGTGILTKHLQQRLRKDAHLVVTDISATMLELGKARVGFDERIEWRIADATALPFDDNTFDAVVGQFGLMFFADKVGALREVRRVVKDGGTVLLNTWASLADNPIARIAHDEVASFFHTNPPSFFSLPYGLHDQTAVKQMFSDAGFESVDCDVVDYTATSASAQGAAKGLVFGTPLFTQIQDRGTADPTAIMHAVATRLAEAGGAQPMRLPMRALVFTAR
jgi:ubiquinone/menaquinone biosynthesis C-methylase UbiE